MSQKLNFASDRKKKQITEKKGTKQKKIYQDQDQDKDKGKYFR